MSTGFPARGIISCRKTPTEALQDYVDFLVNPAMKQHQSYIKDTKHALQLIKKANEEGKVTDDTNLVTADFENMYGKMPLQLSKAGVQASYCPSVGGSDLRPDSDELMEALDLCQENNVFEFAEKLYKQKQGHGTGQKQAPPVACAGAAVAEQKWMEVDGVAELWKQYGRYIDDILGLFKGDREQCEWAFQQFNSLYPGHLVLTWEWSAEKAIFLNIELRIDRVKKVIETKYYVKPSNQRLFLNYRSNHPEHVFKAVVYGMALQGIMVNSLMEWNCEYLSDLREKFRQQEYPLKMINDQFKRALTVSREDLLLRTPAQGKKKRNVIAPLVVTYNPGNPPFKLWIKELIEILHKDKDLKALFPKVDVVTRQNANIKKRIMRNRFVGKVDAPANCPPAGNFKLHSKRCMCCDRMEDGKNKLLSSKTKREYKIKRHYTCQTTHCVYVLTCALCWAQYTGQTIRCCQKRHYGHRGEVKRGDEGMGAHFHAHAVELGLDLNTQLDEIMKHCQLTIVASVEPGLPGSKERLDRLEADIQNRLMTMERHGGMNLREEMRRGRGGGQ